MFMLMPVMPACAVLPAGCVPESEHLTGSDLGNPLEGEPFDYVTATDVPLNIDYSVRGNKALFEIYTENPLSEQDGIPRKKSGIKSLLKAYTDKDSKYAGTINLTTASDKV